ncbi:unnamed protein product [Lampetra planeri]
MGGDVDLTMNSVRSSRREPCSLFPRLPFTFAPAFQAKQAWRGLISCGERRCDGGQIGASRGTGHTERRSCVARVGQDDEDESVRKEDLRTLKASLTAIESKCASAAAAILREEHAAGEAHVQEATTGSTGRWRQGRATSLSRPKCRAVIARSAWREVPFLRSAWPAMGGPRAHQLLLLATLCCLAQLASPKILEDTYERWNGYRKDCYQQQELQPLPMGVYCNRTFDRYACWPDALPDSVVNVSCPWYVPWHDKVRHGLAYRRCGPDGQWETDGDGQPWRDLSQCADPPVGEQSGQSQILSGYKTMYTVGYSLSLAVLTIALGVLLSFRRLHCTRNSIHANLFASFMLRAASILVRDALLETRWDMPLGDSMDWGTLISDEAAAGCRTAQVLTQYCIVANYYWLLVEGVYLHTLLVVPVFSEETYFKVYLAVGWGTPVLFVAPWVVVKYLKENTECWGHNENMGYWWIIRTPIHLAILINFIMFIRILKIITSKLRAHQMGYTDFKFRLAKSTLTLIPLLGIHEIVFTFITDEHAHDALRHVKLFFALFFNSFQGLFVAILYCFVTREVQAEVRKQWKRWRLGKELESRLNYIQVSNLKASRDEAEQRNGHSTASTGLQETQDLPSHEEALRPNSLCDAPLPTPDTASLKSLRAEAPVEQQQQLQQDDHSCGTSCTPVVTFVGDASSSVWTV